MAETSQVRVTVDRESLERIELARMQIHEQADRLEADGRAWDRRLGRLRSMNRWQTGIGIAWMLLLLATWIGHHR